jgi:hypothetical protein
MGIAEHVLAAAQPDSYVVIKPLMSLLPIQPVSSFVSHLVASPVFPSYFPVARLGALHAARAAITWAHVTRPKRGSTLKRVGRMGDLFGYLVLCCMSKPCVQS